MSDLKPCRCPKCGGSGFIPDFGLSSGGATCHVCGGQGVLYPAGWFTAAPPEDELARLEREIAEKEFWEWCDIWDRGGFDVWFQPSDHHFDVGSMAWYGLKRGLLERHPDNPNLVRIKERGDE